MPRYALLGIHSKKLAGVVDANDPIGACKLIEERAGLVGNRYEMLGGDWRGEIDPAMEGYDVHQASPDMEVKEEHREAMTKHIVDGLPRVAMVLVISATSELVAGAKPAAAPPTPEAKKPDEPKPAEAKKPDEPKPAEAKKPDEPKPAEAKKPDEPKPAEAKKPDEPKPAEAAPAEAKKDA